MKTIAGSKQFILLLLLLPSPISLVIQLEDSSRRKIGGHKIELEIVPEIELYKCEPWNLPGVDEALEYSKLQHRLSLPPLELEDFPQIDLLNSKAFKYGFIQENTSEGDA